MSEENMTTQELAQIEQVIKLGFIAALVKVSRAILDGVGTRELYAYMAADVAENIEFLEKLYATHPNLKEVFVTDELSAYSLKQADPKFLDLVGRIRFSMMMDARNVIH